MPLDASEPQFGNVTRQMNKIVDQLQKGFFNLYRAETWMPPVNVYETESAYLVCVDLSGVEKEKIDLFFAGKQLRLRGTRAAPAPPENMEIHATLGQRLRIHLMEIDQGPFQRDIDLPNDVNHERITASYRNGMLWVELQKQP